MANLNSTRPRPRPHGIVRGSNLSRSSVLFGGPFGRIFRALPPAEFGDDDQKTLEALKALAAAMTATPDPIKDGPDAEESGIPAAFTYFGQFIDHDLTFDPASSLQRQNDPDALVDFRTPRFDLDNVYGRGPDDQPYFFEDGRSFILGRELSGAAANPKARDLPRSSGLDAKSPHRAIIGDPRNDENVIISQLQGLFHRFHNKIAAENPDWTFVEVQREVRFHYQWVVLNDYLPTIVSHDVLNQVIPGVGKHANRRIQKAHLEFYHPKEDLFMPLEFSAAAFRFGHSMVRPGYRLSETIGPLAIFTFDDVNKGLTGFRDFPSNWAIDWNLFINLEPRAPGDESKADDPGNKTRMQLAYRLDTSLVNPLGNLPPSIAVHPNILAQRNLERGWRMRLPSGQDIARAMGLAPLPDDKILIGKFTGDDEDILGPITKFHEGFKDKCPLWTYILAETVETHVSVRTTGGEKKIKTRRLGPVGGRIVAETFVGILQGDSNSYLNQDPAWMPPLAENGVFGLRELIKKALQP
jgi:hypothetical protein